MRLFRPQRKKRVSPDCPKCGFTLTKKDYLRGPDLLDITCRDCGHNWREKPLDKRGGPS